MRKKLGRSTNLVRPQAPPLPAGNLIFERTFAATSEAKIETLEALLAALLSAGALSGESAELRFRLCLDEALVNAVMHGNRYDAAKSVRVRAFIDPKSWSVLVEDEGAGFREEDLPDPQAAENLLEESGRGVHLIRSMMDEVSYWSGGAALLMVKFHRRGTEKNGLNQPS
ncbi:MAG TPA: ATP-binding protein [Planctomycetota bacterium]|jgi:serine/threonine-protein kinase RsbW